MIVALSLTSEEGNELILINIPSSRRKRTDLVVKSLRMMRQTIERTIIHIAEGGQIGNTN